MRGNGKIACRMGRGLCTLPMGPSMRGFLMRARQIAKADLSIIMGSTMRGKLVMGRLLGKGDWSIGTEITRMMGIGLKISLKVLVSRNGVMISTMRGILYKARKKVMESMWTRTISSIMGFSRMTR